MKNKAKYTVLSFLALAIIGNTICSEEALDEQMSEQVIQAAENGDARRVDLILVSFPHLIDYFQGGTTPLCVAAFYGQQNVVETLLRRGAQIDKTTELASSPLTIAALKGRTEIVRILLQHGANIEHREMMGNSALNRAAWGGYFDTCLVLLRHGANIETNDNAGKTPLHTATARGHVNVARLLLEEGANVKACDYRYGLTPLAWLFQDTSWIQWLPASAEKKLAIIKLLISYGAEITDDIAEKINTEFPQYYWPGKRPAGNASPNRQLASQIHLWMRSQTLPIHTATQNGKLAAIRTELQYGADIDAQDALGNTPLHLAAIHGRLSAALVLLNYDATIDALNLFGQTPLYCVAADTKGTYRNARRQLKMIMILIYNDAKVTEDIDQAIKQAAHFFSPGFDWRIEKLVRQERIKGVFDIAIKEGIIEVPAENDPADNSARECVMHAVNELFGLLLVKGESEAQSEAEDENNCRAECNNIDLKCCQCLSTARELADNPLWAICHQSQKHRVCEECFRGMQGADRARNCPLCQQPIIG